MRDSEFRTPSPGASPRLAVSARRTVLHLSRASRWIGLLIDAIARLRALAVPG